ncbi:nucleotidyltransferase domain-containing protein [Aureispira anguillae]|uniref:Nucleotidyltransferase domain-containing protein n=1 Tax=Aureispira anguillae TaxID=2864201 RepID=A0A915YIX3_9BACT|nr:nucleotidyltransferase domain-containing protein [Aureispira anguillae]BDS13801.1 nucleotidyltransferase domain-containing protein [Aureispira anguillae]
MLSIKDIKEKKLLLFECISGSKAYGLDLPTSDTDIKGVFVLPKSMFYGLEYISQINGANNDEVYYELTRFIELLYKNNPNILELLNTPKDCILYKHPLFDYLKPDLFLSKQCRDTFGGYAMSQIKKARGLNKKIMNPMEKKRKSVLDFCYVQYQQGALSLGAWLDKKGFKQENCGLVNIPNMRDLYGLYYDSNKEYNFQGIIRSNTVDTVALSSVPQEAQQVAILSFNKDGYKKYCKDYKQYWDWVSKRNNSRYENTIAHGKNYDAKNSMHTFRLLDMAEEILALGKIRVKRPNREQLLKIRKGEFEYQELINQAKAKISRIDALFDQSPLPMAPDKEKIEQLLVQIRTEFYRLHS